MRSCVWIATAVFLFCGSVTLAEDKPNPDQLKKAYDDALVQLKAAQDSKNALSQQADKLTHETEELKKQLGAAQAQIQELKREVADNEEHNYDLRSFRAAWQAFLRVHPDLMVRWKMFLGDDALSAPQPPEPLVNPGWPLLDGPPETAHG